MLTLYHGRTSVCSIKVRLALAEKGVSFDSRLMTLRGDQFDPGYMKLNPNAVVPTIAHDGTVVVESTVIMHYIDEAFPGPTLLPADALARSKVRMMSKLMDEYVHVACMTLTFATGLIWPVSSGRWPMQLQRPTSGVSTSSSSRGCGTTARECLLGTTASGRGRRSRPASTIG
jgi:glutathione S-transferase